jgi:hypothetical protein
MLEWISTQYRLPPPNEEVLAWDGVDYWLVTYSEGKWKETLDFQIVPGDMLARMPLPLPPKEE